MSENTKNVLIFSTNYLPAIGGAEVAVGEITDRIDPDDISFDMVTALMERTRAREEQFDNVTVYRLGVGIPFLDKLMLPILGALKAWRLNGSKKYDVFWGVMVSFGTLAAYICNLTLGKQRVPIVLTLQEGDSELHLKNRWAGLIDWWWRYTIPRADTVTAISSYLAKRAKEYGYQGKVKIVPNGVDIERFGRDVPDETRRELKEKLGKEKHERYIITTSRLVEKNAVDDIIRALVDLPEHVSLLVLGEGEERRSLERLAKELDVRDRVQFLGLVPHIEIPNYLAVSDVFVRPSRSEGMGNSFIEAMAAGLPIVATEVGGIVDFLKDRKTGIACEVNNPESIARAVNILLRDMVLRQEIIVEAREVAHREYSWKRVTNEMKEVFESFSA